MARTQTDEGGRIAQLYDVDGKLTPGAELLDHEINLVHDMGAQMFAEGARLSTRNIAVTSEQSLAFGGAAEGLPSIFKVIGWQVFSEHDPVRLRRVTLLLEDAESATIALPFFVWDAEATVPGTLTGIQQSGGSASLLVPNPASAAMWPQRAFTVFQGSMIGNWNIGLRGLTSAFGAGTTTITARIHLLFYTPQVTGAIAPIPSW